MPTYIYKCTRTHGEFEVFHSISSPPLESCPQCDENGLEKEAPERLIGQTSFILQGGGWFREGYSK